MSLFIYATKRGTLRRRLVHSLALPHHQPSPQSASTSLRSAAVPTLTLMTVGLRLVSCWFGVVGWVWCAPRVRWVCTRWWCGFCARRCSLIPQSRRLVCVIAHSPRFFGSLRSLLSQASQARLALVSRFARGWLTTFAFGWQDFVHHLCWRVRSLTVPAPEVRHYGYAIRNAGEAGARLSTISLVGVHHNSLSCFVFALTHGLLTFFVWQVVGSS